MDRDCSVEMNVESNPAGKAATACNSHWKYAALATAVLFAGFLCITLTLRDQGHTGNNENHSLQLRQISKSVRAAIHLEGQYNKDLSSSVEWKKDVDQYHSEGELELEDNEIVIPAKGLYFVYSQASFRVSCNADPDDQSRQRLKLHLSSQVKRWSDSNSSDREHYETLLHSVRTACEKTAPGDEDAKTQGKWFNAVYMGAVFHLNEGDRLKTEIPKQLLPDVDVGPGSTFFGVFAL